MNAFDPWTRELSGFFMLRFCPPDGVSYYGIQYPKQGYVAATQWDDTYDVLEDIPGIYGYLHAEGGVVGRDPSASMRGFHEGIWLYPEHVLQIISVNAAEVRSAPRNTFRIPRGWIKCTGTCREVARCLELDGSDYALTVRSNMIENYFQTIQIPFIADRIIEWGGKIEERFT